MSTLLILTGPQGSGNHLFAKVFSASARVYGWDSLYSKTWVGHHEEPFAKYWETPSMLSTFDWKQSEFFVTSISCPYFLNGTPTIPNYRTFIEQASKHVDNVKLAVVGRDQTIMALQQERVRGAPTLQTALREFEFLFSSFNCTFVSQELLYLYRHNYVKQVMQQIGWPTDMTRVSLDQILAIDANTKYVSQAAGALDSYIISASKNSFRMV